MRIKKIHVVCVVGTRPEAIKMAPVVLALKQKKEIFRTTMMVTAQHREMLDQVLKTFALHPQIDLNLMQPNQTLAQLQARALIGCETIFKKIKPDVVLVQGDTTTTVSAALAAFYQRIPVGHIEAGLRTFDKYNPFPEEINRCLVSTLASWHFAATRTGQRNLLDEGYVNSTIFITGNPVVDAMQSVLHNADHTIFKKLGFDPRQKRVVLITAHRRENFGKPLQAICSALLKLSNRFPMIEFVFPVHPNPAVRSIVNQMLRTAPDNIKHIQPMDYSAFIHLLQYAELVLTDSGGIQEEAPALGVPVFILRKKTERPEALKAGAKLIPLDEQIIVKKVTARLNLKIPHKNKISCPFGDGQAAARIVEFLLWHFKFRKTRPKCFNS